MGLLHRIRKYYLYETPGWKEGVWISFLIVFILLKLALVKLRVKEPLILFATFVIVYFTCSYSWPSIGISQDGLRMLVKNSPSAINPIVPLAMRFLWTAPQLLFGTADKRYLYAKDAAGEFLLRCSNTVHINLYTPEPPIPASQILITNHVPFLLLDGVGFFSFIRKNSEILVIQHEFYRLVTYISRNAWGAWTINKDDKTADGKRKLRKHLSDMIRYVRTRKNPITVVVYPTGKGPRTPEQTLRPPKFLPGAFYLSLMTGLPITPLVTYQGHHGDFRMHLLPTRDICAEYEGRYRPLPAVNDFRTDETNRVVLEEIAESFRQQFIGIYNKIETEQRI